MGNNNLKLARCQGCGDFIDEHQNGYIPWQNQTTNTYWLFQRVCKHLAI